MQEDKSYYYRNHIIDSTRLSSRQPESRVVGEHSLFHSLLPSYHRDFLHHYSNTPPAGSSLAHHPPPYNSVTYRKYPPSYSSDTMMRHYYNHEIPNHRYDSYYQRDDHIRGVIVDDLLNTAINTNQSIDRHHPRNYDRRTSLELLSDMKNNSNRRYSLSNGSIYFPSMSLQDLNKIDTTQHNVGCYTVPDAKLYQESNVSTKSLFDKYIELNDSFRYLNKKRKMTGPELLDDLSNLKAPRRDSMFSLSHSRRNSILSVSESIGDQDFSLLPLTSLLDQSIRDVDTLDNDSESGEHEPLPTTFDDEDDISEVPCQSDDLVVREVDPVLVETSEPRLECELIHPIPHHPTMVAAYDPDVLSRAMESFANSMAESSKSQLSIHEWDKKMGLKRSHSKTMRLSMRTRKELRAIIKKELSHS